jgi:hypothetical protein
VLNEGVVSEWWFAKDMAVVSFKVLPPEFSWRDWGKPQSRQLVSGLRFEPGTSYKYEARVLTMTFRHGLWSSQNDMKSYSDLSSAHGSNCREKCWANTSSKNLLQQLWANCFISWPYCRIVTLQWNKSQTSGLHRSLFSTICQLYFAVRPLCYTLLTSALKIQHNFTTGINSSAFIVNSNVTV